MSIRLRATIRWLLRGTVDERLRASWRIVLAVVLTFVGALGGTVVVERVDPSALLTPLVAHSFAVVAVLVTVAVVARYVDRRPVSEYGFDLSRGWGVDAVVGAVLGVGLVGLAFGLASRRGTVAVVEVLSTGTAGSFTFGFLVVALGWVFVGFWEETLFRGLFLRNAADGLTVRGATPVTAALGAWLSSSLVYGALHGPFGSTPATVSLAYALLMTAVMGGLFGLAYLLTGELALPIGLHAGINFAEQNLFLGSPGGVAPAVLRVEYATAGGPVQFQSVDPLVIVPVFVAGYALVAGWAFLRHGGVSIRLGDRREHREFAD